MPNGRDGGEWALAGFLYQILGVLSIPAYACRPIDISDHEDSNEVDSLLTLIGVGNTVRAHHEWFGQDALLSGDDRCVLVQFKYSSTGRKIHRGELEDIVRRLHESVEQAELRGQNVTACALFTNRRLTSKGGRAAKQYWEAEQQRDRGYQLRYVFNSMGSLLNELREFGKAYGLFDHEIETGVNNLVGRVLRETGELFGSTVDEGHLVESFTGYREARPLTIASVAELACEQLDQFGETIHVDQWDNMPVRRDVSEDIAEAVNSRALVGLHGKGGCGKSIILWQLLDQEGGCCMIRQAEDFYDSWVVDTVHTWRNLPVGRRPDDDRERAISRFVIANRDQHRQILWLALDGLDEGVRLDQRPHIQEFIRWFWHKDRECRESGIFPSAALVVSCRRREDLESLLSRRQYDYPGEYPPSILVGDFSISEIEEAARRTFPELHRRILAKFGNQLGLLESGYRPIPLEYTSRYPEPGLIDDVALEALKHPAMWRALLSLDDDLTRIGVIEGEEQATHHLALEFIKWFHWKLVVREERFQGLLRDTLVEILSAIAQYSSRTVAHSRDDGWREPACQTNRVNEGEAIVLYDEALSAGLITEDARLLWRWRHSIVYDYLASNAQVG